MQAARARSALSRAGRQVAGGLQSLASRPASAVGLVLTLLFVTVALIGPLLAPFTATATDGPARAAPSATYLFGTDHLGRDVFSRVVLGTGSVLSLAGLGTALAVAIGLSFGLLAGYRGGLFDEILMRAFDSLLAIPALLLALLLLGTFGPSQSSVLIVIPVVYTPIVARVARSEVLRIRSRGFVEAARLRGESLPFILFREILPSLLPPLSVEAALRFSYAIFLVASLGFLGVGVQPPTPDWGLMVNEARTFVRLTPWALYFPAAAISLLVIGVNLLADGLKRVLQQTEGAPSRRDVRAAARDRAAVAMRTAGGAAGTAGSNAAADAAAPPTAVAGPGAPAVLSVQQLTVSYYARGTRHDVVRDATLAVARGQTYGIVGESGSGKTTLVLAALRYLERNGAVTAGGIAFGDRDLLASSEPQLRRLRGSRITLVPQDPLSALNPSLRIGVQLTEALELHGRREQRSPAGTGTDDLGAAAVQLLESVGIADPERVAGSYPHQLSGGMQQRVMIAMALSTEPELLILDEPTTGLDVTTEAVVLDLVRELIERHGTSALYISHDLGVVAQVSDRVAVLYAGELVEDAPTANLFRRPLHPYTRGLLDSVPRIGQSQDHQLASMTGQIPRPGDLPEGCVFAPRCPVAEQLCHDRRPELEPAALDGDDGDGGDGGDGGEERHLVRCHRWREIAAGTIDASSAEGELVGTAAASAVPAPAGQLQLDAVAVHFPLQRSVWDLLRRRPATVVRAVDGVSLTLAPGETLGVVGESGSGKSTLAHAALGIVAPTAGTVRLDEQPLPARLQQRSRNQLASLQLVAQNPYEALNPYMRVGTILRRSLQRLLGHSRERADREVAQLLEDVGLYRDYTSRLPAQLSGGEKQRVAIARAIAGETRVVICDEPTSALDVSVQARILNLLAQLRREHGSAYLFISHDLATVSYLADHITVLYLGQVMENGTRRQVLSPPYHPYTEALLSAFAVPDTEYEQERIRLTGDVPSPTAVPRGCPFHTRCHRYLGDLCAEQTPPRQVDGDGHMVFCHIPLEELRAGQRPVIRAASAAAATPPPQPPPPGRPH